MRDPQDNSERSKGRLQDSHLISRLMSADNSPFFLIDALFEETVKEQRMRFEVNHSFGWFVLVMAGLSWPVLGWTHWTWGLWAGLLAGASVMLHEVGHALVAWACGVRVKRIGFSKGGYIIREYARTRLRECLITLAGPGANLLLFLIFAMLPHKFGQWVSHMNLLLAIFNLIPIGPSDGSRLLHPRCTILPVALPVAEQRKAA